MQQRPSKSALLQAVARFLIGEAYPNIHDKRLSFRVLIAANLANIVAGEIEFEQVLMDAEIARLKELLPDASERNRPESEEERREMLTELNRELAARIRQNSFGPRERGRVWNHVKETLIQTLGIDNPRFDTSAEIE